MSNIKSYKYNNDVRYPEEKLTHIIFQNDNLIYNIYQNLNSAWQVLSFLRNQELINNIYILSLPTKYIHINLSKGVNSIYLIYEIIDDKTMKEIGLYSDIPDKYYTNKYNIKEYIFHN